MKKLNFGCGKIIKKGWVNTDFQKGKGIDESFDFTKYPYPFKDNTFDEILLDNVLEHLPSPQRVMRELWRISKKDTEIRIIVPYYNTYYAWGDPTHVNFFNESTIRQVLGEVDYNVIQQKEKFKIIELNPVPQRFLKWIPMPILNILKRFLGNIIIELKLKIKVVK